MPSAGMLADSIEEAGNGGDNVVGGQGVASKDTLLPAANGVGVVVVVPVAVAVPFKSFYGCTSLTFVSAPDAVIERLGGWCDSSGGLTHRVV